MVGQRDWLKAVVDLANRIAEVRDDGNAECRAQLLPVVLHDSFYRTGSLYQNFNPIRLLDLSSEQMEVVLPQRPLPAYCEPIPRATQNR